VVLPVLVSASAQTAAQPPGGLVASTPGFGATEGTFSVSPDGAPQYTLPLWVPDGRGQLQPQLALSYNGGAGNSVLGVGWSLSGLPSITPCQRTLAQDGVTERVHYDGSDRYCLGGNRLLPASGGQVPEREYRTEREMFARIVAYGMQDNVPDYFRVWDRGGKILTFGQSEGTRLRAYKLRVPAGDPEGQLVRDGTARVTAAWFVQRIEDRNGNVLTVDYQASEGTAGELWHAQMNVSTINYGPNRSVRFFYEDRPDPIDSFDAGVHTRTGTRLSRITMHGGPQGGTAELLREYRLGYQSTSITGRSLLRTVTECDHNGACKLPLSFNWSQGSHDFDVTDTNITDVGTSVNSGNRVVVGDIDGDGRDDLLYPDAQNNWKIRRSTGTGYSAAVPAGIPWSYPNRQAQLRPIDFDRDGRMDVMAETLDASYGDTGWVLFRSNGATFDRHPQDIGYSGPLDDELDPMYFADLDGNGMPDLVTANWEFIHPDAGRIDGPWSYRLNTGSDAGGRFQAKVQTTAMTPAFPSNNRVVDFDGDGRAELGGSRVLGDPPGYPALGLGAGGGAEVNLVNTGSSENWMYFGDLNADGLADAVYPYSGLKVRFNSANGFGPATASPAGYEEPREDVPPFGDFDRGVRVGDFNNDGHDDVFIAYGHEVAGPDRTALLYTWRGGGFVRTPLIHAAGDWTARGFAATQLTDIDGDGALDIVNVKNGHLRILKRRGGIPDRLLSVDVEMLGRRLEVDYSTLADRAVHTPGQCAYPLVCPTKGGSAVREHRLANGLGQLNRFTHTYVGARVDLRGRGWLGFAGHTVTDVRAGITTVTSFDNTTRAVGATSEYQAVAAYPYAHLPKVVETITVSFQGRQHRRVVTNTHVLRRLAVAGAYTVELRAVVEVEYERAGTGAWQSVRTRNNQREYDQFGNPTLAAGESVGGRRLREVTEYRNDQGAWLIGLQTRQLSTGCTASNVCAVRESTFDYDANGNMTETVTEPNNATLRLRQSIVLTDFGNIGSVTTSDATGSARKEVFGYDADKLHAVVFTNPMNHTIRLTMHSGLGVPLSSTAPDGVLTTMRHDWFGRLRETNHADGSFEHFQHQILFGAQTIFFTEAGGGQRITTLDALGREISKGVKTFNGNISFVHTVYDALGRVEKVSRPALAGDPLYNTTTSYDRRGRVISRQEPDGATVRHEYIGLETHTYDAKGVHSYTRETVDGEIESRYEDDPASTGWLRTRFEYGPFGEVTKSVAADGTTQTMTYDLLGRRIRHSDPAAGVTATTFNAFGEIRTETNGAGHTSQFDYDALGRVTRTTSPDGTATNTWDSAANGKGKLASARSADGVVTDYSYNPLGQTTSTRWTIEGTPYEIANTYDSVGRTATITYPKVPGVADRFKVANVYNEHGYLRAVRDPAASVTYWQATRRNAAGQLERELYGSGAETFRTYQPTTGLLQRILVESQGAGGTLDDISYGYDANRNVILRHDVVNQRRETYHHDALNRLDDWLSVTGQVIRRVGYTYDKLGNLKTETTIGGGPTVTYGYGQNGAPPHALTNRNTATYTYDGAGRQLTGPARTVQYNRAGLPTVLTWGQGKRTDFDYDADGARVAKRDAAQHVITVGGLFERRVSQPGGDPYPDAVGARNVHHVIVEGRIVAQVVRVQATATGPITATATSYLHTDLQGSIVQVSGADGKLKEELFYDPFGDRIRAGYEPVPDDRRGDPRFGYTGHEHDDELGLINMKGRVYDPQLRRFLTPDPVVSDPGSSQSHNRYSYVWNNPTTDTDPTGFWRSDSFWHVGREDGGTADSNRQPEETAEIYELNPTFGAGGEKADDQSTQTTVAGGKNTAASQRALEDRKRKAVMDEARKDAQTRKPFMKSLSDKDLHRVIDYLRSEVRRNGTCTSGSSSECFMHKADLEMAEAVMTDRNTPYHGANGLQGRKYDLARAAYSARVQAELAALTGNLASWVTFVLTGDTELAKLFGGVFGGIGKHVERTNAWKAHAVDPVKNPLPAKHFGEVYDRFSNR
jgi:RHS repeat-associated protein